MLQPTLSQAITLSQGYPYLPVFCTIDAKGLEPVSVLRKLKTVSTHCYLLESLAETDRRGRYTFLGYDPKLEITCTDGRLRMRGAKELETQTDSPAQVIEEILAEYKSPRLAGLPTFSGGLVGYFSYDFLKYSEPSLAPALHDAEGFQDVDLMLFDKVIAFDHLTNTVILIVHIPTKHLAQQYARAEQTLSEMQALIQRSPTVLEEPLCLLSPLKPLFDQKQYCNMVERAKEYIREGDIFQVVLSNRLEAEVSGSLLGAYEALRESNPSPYMFYFSSADIEMVGASPETLVKLEDGTVSTFPLAGTRPRGKTPEADAALERELCTDPKELAEHNMLVDLGRNDLGKICTFGSVHVENYLSVERFSHVMHLGSTVRGTLRKENTAMDAISAVLPAGTLSGAPKIRACEIIQELENNKRGVYGGGIGYLDFSGNMDTCIAIRFAFQKNGRVYIRSGAGIVADSVPESEYQECIHKAQAVVNALYQAEGSGKYATAD